MDSFISDLVIFSIMNDYGIVGMILDELKVNLSWPKVRVLMIMCGFAFLYQACYLCTLG